MASFCCSLAVEQGLQRIRSNMEQYGVWQRKYESAILPLIGEMSLPKLGLGDETWASLSTEVCNADDVVWKAWAARRCFAPRLNNSFAGRLSNPLPHTPPCLPSLSGTQIDAIIHSASLVHFLYPYELLKHANVRGTVELLRLSVTHRLKVFHSLKLWSLFCSFLTMTSVPYVLLRQASLSFLFDQCMTPTQLLRSQCMRYRPSRSLEMAAGQPCRSRKTMTWWGSMSMVVTANQNGLPTAYSSRYGSVCCHLMSINVSWASVPVGVRTQLNPSFHAGATGGVARSYI